MANNLPDTDSQEKPAGRVIRMRSDFNSSQTQINNMTRYDFDAIPSLANGTKKCSEPEENESGVNHLPLKNNIAEQKEGTETSQQAISIHKQETDQRSEKDIGLSKTQHKEGRNQQGRSLSQDVGYDKRKQSRRQASLRCHGDEDEDEMGRKNQHRRGPFQEVGDDVQNKNKSKRRKKRQASPQCHGDEDEDETERKYQQERGPSQEVGNDVQKKNDKKQKHRRKQQTSPRSQGFSPTGQGKENKIESQGREHQRRQRKHQKGKSLSQGEGDKDVPVVAKSNPRTKGKNQPLSYPKTVGDNLRSLLASLPPMLNIYLYRYTEKGKIRKPGRLGIDSRKKECIRIWQTNKVRKEKASQPRRNQNHF